MTAREYGELLSSHLENYNQPAVEEVCTDIITSLYAAEGEFEVLQAEKIMQSLRNKRQFLLMQQVGDVLIQTGRHSFRIRRQYAQALIDQNHFTAAISILTELAKETGNAATDLPASKEEHAEAKGLLGRTYKQLYINSSCCTTSHSIAFLKTAVRYYMEVYTDNPQVRTWHGINLVALLYRAEQDNITLAGFPSPSLLAEEILSTIQIKYEEQQAGHFDFATAAEACVALDRPEEALKWMSGYARMPYCDAFELSSTLRQLEEVWKVKPDSTLGRLLLPLLRAELLTRIGATVNLEVEELNLQRQDEGDTSSRYNKILEENTGTSSQSKSKTRPVLEKVFGQDSFQTYKWFMTGIDRCLAVARIGQDSSKGFGTGFLLQGKALHDLFGEELLLLTNTHVISDRPEEKALRPEEAIIIFEGLDREAEFGVAEIIWSSPSEELDATVIRFSPADHERLQVLTKAITLYPIARHLPVPDPDYGQRVYIIGHPLGGTLQISLHDNLLLDHEDPKIHYRTPTEGGSSGSPIFNQQWALIGLHHAGSQEMNCLNGKPGVYEANEGIWIQSIRRSIAQVLTGTDDRKIEKGDPEMLK